MSSRALRTGPSPERGLSIDRCLALVEAVPAHLWGPDQSGWIAQLERERETIDSALALCFGDEAECGPHTAAAHEAGLRLAAAMGPFWHTQGRIQEGRRWLTLALERTAAQTVPPRSRIRALQELAGLRSLQGEYAAAGAAWSESLCAARDAGDAAAVAWAHHGLAHTARELRDYAGASALLRHSLEGYRAVGDERAAALVIIRTGRVALLDGQGARAADLLAEGTALVRRAGGSRARTRSLLHEGMAAHACGDAATATRRLQEGSRLAQRLSMRLDATDCLVELAKVFAGTGRATDAARLFGATAAARERMAVVVAPSRSGSHRAAVAHARERLGAPRFAAFYDEGRRLSLNETAHLAGEPRRIRGRIAGGAAEPLTPREREVVTLVVDGLTNRQIGDRLVVTSGTAKRHLENVLGKLGLRSRAQLAAWASRGQTEHGLPSER